MTGNLHVPYEQLIHLEVGSTVKIMGSLPDLADSFQVEFFCGSSEDDDIAFQFDVHVGQCVMMDSRVKGNWMNKKQSDFMPFSRGETFDLQFAVTKDNYKVSVDGKSGYEFEHFLPVMKVQMVKISRDVFLNEVSMM